MQLDSVQCGNLAFSPASVSTALAMTYAGARGQTAAEMKAALRLEPSGERLHPANGDMHQQKVVVAVPQSCTRRS